METLNITEIISTTINTIFSNLFSSIDNSLYGVLDDITFINTNILNDSYFEKIFGANPNHGILLICNSLVIAFLLYYAISLLLSHITFTNVTRPLPFIFKLVLFTILMNFSPFICEKFIEFNSYVSTAIRQIGESLFNKSICFSSLIQNLDKTITIDSENFNLFSIDGLLKCFISFSLFNLILSYSLRYIMVKVFLLIAPFAFLSLASEKTTWFFHMWIRTFCSLLFVQLLISLILLITFSFDFTNTDLFSKILLIGSIYALVKANLFIKELMGGISTTVSMNIRNFRTSIQ